MNSIAQTVKTPRLHDANRPFGAAPMVKPPPTHTDPDALEICDDPLPAHRARPENKYHAKFGALKPGQAIKCPPGDVGRVAGAMRKWLTTSGKTGAIRTIRDYGDGMGRVWLIDSGKQSKTQKAAA